MCGIRIREINMFEMFGKKKNETVTENVNKMLKRKKHWKKRWIL